MCSCAPTFTPYTVLSPKMSLKAALAKYLYGNKLVRSLVLTHSQEASISVWLKRSSLWLLQSWAHGTELITSCRGRLETAGEKSYQSADREDKMTASNAMGLKTPQLWNYTWLPPYSHTQTRMAFSLFSIKSHSWSPISLDMEDMLNTIVILVMFWYFPNLYFFGL